MDAVPGIPVAIFFTPSLSLPRQDSIPDPSPAPLWVGDRVCVEALDLKGCSALTDHDVAVMCEEMHAVREVRLSNCPRGERGRVVVGAGGVEWHWGRCDPTHAPIHPSPTYHPMYPSPITPRTPHPPSPTLTPSFPVGDGAMEALSRYASTTPRDADALASARESSQSVPGVRSVSAAGCAAITDAGAWDEALD